MSKHNGKIKVVEKKLGRAKAWGLAYQGEQLIEIDPRQKPSSYLNTLIHEALHLAFTDLGERRVRRISGELTRVILGAGFRRLQK